MQILNIREALLGGKEIFLIFFFDCFLKKNLLVSVFLQQKLKGGPCVFVFS